jgi:GDP/UDP-N,N'-diacetylbacillosamine 2-epimerase (hydrolysing)
LNKIKNIAVFTSIRSEYGLLSPLIRAIGKDSDFSLDLLVGGAHLIKEYGETINQIIADGFKISETFDFLDINNHDDFSTSSLSKLQEQIGKYFYFNRPDLIFVLGDRYELIPVASSALLYNIPIAHISGGETTEGAIDNQIRHALTKMAHLHFPATDIYKKNILKMGEEEWRICTSGEPGLDEILNMDFIEKDDLFEDLGLSLKKKTICCTFHPQTIDNLINIDFVKSLLEEISCYNEFQVLITASNFDNGGREINGVIEKFASENSGVVFVQSLGQKRYYSLLKHADIMIGNSSSGLVEAQSFNLPVINVGNRQKGRLSNVNVINCGIDINEILDTIKFVVSDEFKAVFYNKPNIYGDGTACVKIINFLKALPSNNLLVKKDIF